MLENIGNVIKCMQINDLDKTWVIASHHVPDMSALKRLPWRRPLPSNCALNMQQIWASAARTRDPILMKLEIWYTTANQEPTESCDQILKFLIFKMADGRHVGKYQKCHNQPTNGPIWTKLRWSHPIMSMTCPPLRLDAVAMVAAVTQQPRVEQLAVIGVWRLSA